MKFEQESAVSAARSALSKPGVDFSRNVHGVLGLPFDAVNLNEAVALVRRAALSQTRCFISTPNLNFVVAAIGDPAFRESVLRSDLSLADGMSLVWAAQFLKVPIPGRVAGADLFEQLLAADGPPVDIFLFGGPDGAAQEAAEQIRRRAGGLRCVGFESPGFGSIEDISSDEQIDRINASGAQFLMVALGAKKGQAWIVRNLDRLSVPVICHLGAVINFASNRVQRAPQWVRNVGFEWLWRIYQEPTLWRRYWDDGSQLLRLGFSHLVPLRWSLRQPGPTGQASVQVSNGASGAVVLRLSGPWGRANLDPLRQALGQALDARAPVTVVLTEVSDIDYAWLGLVSLAYGQLSAAHRWQLQGASPQVANKIRRFGFGYLMD